MIPSPLLAIPPEEDTEKSPSSQYVSKKDIKWLLVFIIIFAIIAIPLYGMYKRQADTHVCAANMNSVYQALSLYAVDHDDRFPPLVDEDPTGSPGAPKIVDGKVISWVTKAFEYDHRAEIFHCPAAKSDEGTPTEGAIHVEGAKAKHITIDDDYGMYAGYSAAMKSSIDRSSQVVFIAETSNNGSQESFDPLPFKDAKGNRIPYDGFSIGWNDNNLSPGLLSKQVTRLSFRFSSTGNVKDAEGRHGNWVHAITPDGNLLLIAPSQMNMQTRGGVPVGEWQAPALIAR